MSETDGKLIERTLSGEKGAFAEIVRRHVGGLVAYAFGLTNSRAEAEELAQETFVRAYRQLRSLPDAARVGPWLNDVLLATQREWTRKKTRTFESVVTAGESSSAAADPELVSNTFPAVAKAIAALDEPSRTVLALRFINGYSPEEIGSFSGETAAAINQRITRAHKLLRESLMRSVDLSRFAPGEASSS